MEMNSNSTVSRIIILIYGALYFVGFMFPLITSDFKEEGMSPLELITVPLAFFFFFAGTLVMYKNEMYGGQIILFWHVLVWFFSLFLWPDAGMILVLIFPMLFPAIILIKNWNIKNQQPDWSTNVKMWSKTLHIFLINYAIIYLLVIISDLLPRIFHWDLKSNVDELAVWSYTSPTGFLLILGVILFVIALINSKKSFLFTGTLLILWYALIAIATFGVADPLFLNSGPWFVFGLVFLIHGILYIKLHYMERETVFD